MYYIITKGYYSDKHIVAVTCDKQKAEKIKECYSNEYNDADIEKWEESTVSFENYYHVEYNTDDSSYKIEKEPPDELYSGVNSICEYYHNDGFSVNVQAENEDVALKIARDLWAEYKAEKEGII